MYCKKCGKQIAPDSCYCQYCGTKVSENNTDDKNSIYNYLKKLDIHSRRYIVICNCIILICSCITISLYITNSNDSEEWLVFLIILIFAFILSLIVLYYIKNLLHTRGNTPSGSQHPTIQQKNDNVEKYSLKEFSILYGKMRVVLASNNSDNDLQTYCTFTNENGVTTKVFFSKSLGELSASEISNQKDNLCICKVNNTYELAYVR